MLSYGLQGRYLGSFASDFSSGVLRSASLFDAIVTDPPYGVREASLKVNKDIKNSQYSLSEQFLELLNFAARNLVIGTWTHHCSMCPPLVIDTHMTPHMTPLLIFLGLLLSSLPGGQLVTACCQGPAHFCLREQSVGPTPPLIPSLRSAPPL